MGTEGGVNRCWHGEWSRAGEDTFRCDLCGETRVLDEEDWRRVEVLARSAIDKSLQVVRMSVTVRQTARPFVENPSMDCASFIKGRTRRSEK